MYILFPPQINWQALYTDDRTHSVALGDLLVVDSASVTFEPDQTEANITITLQQNIVMIHISYTEYTLYFFNFYFSGSY